MSSLLAVFVPSRPSSATCSLSTTAARVPSCRPCCFVAIFVFWTYYPHRVPLLPRTITTMPDAAVKQTPPPAVAPAPSQKPRNPVTDITPPKNPVTDVTPPAPATPPATPAR